MVAKTDPSAKSMRRLAPYSLWPIALIYLAGCKHQSGEASFKFIDSIHSQPATDAREMKLKIGTTVFVEAKPIEPLAIPIYPPIAVAADLGSVTIAVKISVNKDGRVEAVSPSMAGISLPTRFSHEFHEAVETAVKQWRFEPAKLARLEPAKSGPPFVTSTQDTETAFDVAFTFSSPGAVSSAFPRK